MNIYAYRLGALAIWILLAAGSSVFAQRGLKDIPDPDPQKQLAAFEVAEGFEVNLFASDPMIAKPIQINWDARGRLWVASSTIYPHIKPGQKPNDKIFILEDVNHDGVADKCTVFADGLLIPTSVVPGDGGAYVANSTEVLHLKDVDGDGKADESRVVLSGFGTEDTHHIIHTLRFAPDGCLYFNQSIYIHSHIETPWGVRRLRGGGVWRLRPETMQLEVFTRGLVNPWGHVFDRWGQSFQTDGAGGNGINYAFPGAAFATAVDVSRILRGLNPGQPKHCGVEILSGRHLPPSLLGHVITNDFRGNRINRFVLNESGSGYVSRKADDLLRSRHMAFRPIDVKMGPDGAIYVADWYNPIIQHGEVDFRDPRRDHVHGRIWRITAKGRPLVKPPRLVGVSADKLLDALKQPEAWTRDQARRQLQERGAKKVLPALTAWIQRLDPTEDEFEHHRLEGLWLHQSLRVVNKPLLMALLKSPDHHVRAAAVRVAADWREALTHVDELLASAARDKHPQVRLEAINALRGTLPTRNRAAAARSALASLDQPMDDFLDYALWLTVRELSPHWLPAVNKDLDYFGESRRLAYSLKAVNNPSVIDVADRWFRSGRVLAADRSDVLEILASFGGPRHLQLVFAEALAGRQSGKMLAALERAARANRKRRPSGDLSRLADAFKSKDAAVRATALKLAGLWRVTSLDAKLVSAAKTSRDTRLRDAAIEGLALMGDEASRKALHEFCGSKHGLPLRVVAVAALASADLDAAAKQAAVILSELPRGSNAADVFAAFLSRKGGAQALALALAGKRVKGEIAAAGLRRLSSSGRKFPQLALALRKAGGLDPIVKAPSPEELKRLVADVKAQGNVVRGEDIFRREKLGCLKCHSIGGAGGKVGPDLLSIGASAQIDYLFESMLQPSKKIKENYQTVTVITSGGRTLAGVLVRKTDTHLILRDQEDKLLSIPLADIEQRQNSPLSIMPVETTKSLRRDELVDLVRFMSELGKTGGLVVSKTPVVRRWRVLDFSKAINDTVRHHGLAHATTDDPALLWLPAYSLVSGGLPRQGLPSQRGIGGRSYQFLRFELKVVSAGKIGLKINDRAGLRIWAGKKELSLGSLTVAELPTGTHTFTIASQIRRGKRKPLRIELADVPKSTGRAEMVLGK